MAVSLRRTLAVRYSLTMAVALLGIALWAHLGVRGTLRAQLERSLHSSFEIQSLDLVDHQMLTPIREPTEPSAFVNEINRLVVVRDSSGRIIHANTDLSRSLVADGASLRRAMAGERVFRIGQWQPGPALVLTGPAPPGAPAQAAVLEVAASLEPLEAASRRVLHRMLATALLGSLATLVGAWWLARSALAPVGEIAEQADRIQGGTTGQRITVHAHVEELQGLIQVLNAMLGRLERAYEWHRRMIRDLGHDLRTPVATMRAGLELALVSRRTSDEYRGVLASTLEEVERLSLIGDALSLLGRLESGALTTAPEPVDLRSVAHQAIARARERTSHHRLEFEPPEQPVEATVDGRLLGMAMDQLLDNAIFHTPAGTRVVLAVRTANGQAVVSVEDDGPGVPDEMLPHLFERFYRADSARGRDGGPGLGLTVVAAVVELHQGGVAAERSDAGGLRIRLELPLKAEPARRRA